MARRQEAVSFLGRVQQLDTAACAPRSMADSTFPCERKRWAYALLPDNWQRSHPVAMLGEVVLGKVPAPRGKMQRRWIKGIWLGKLDRDDSNVLGTSSGAIAVRSVRRLPKESQTSQELMNDMKGIPWQTRDGMRHKTNRELSQPVALPAPHRAGIRAPGERTSDTGRRWSKR